MSVDWVPNVTPFMLTDDIAYLGSDSISVHCLIAEDGLILLDTGYPNMLPGIEQNLAVLGYSLDDVRYLLHSHGHIDHYGPSGEIVRRTGAKTLIGREDASIVTGERDLSWAKELNLPPADPFTPDIVFADGDILHLGGRTIRCVHAPGHTEGTYAFFIDTFVHGQPMVAAMHGGVGMNSLSKAFLESYNLPLSLRDDFRTALHRLADEHVDIVLGNHPGQNDTLGKLARMTAETNAFVDPDEWRVFLRQAEKSWTPFLQKNSLLTQKNRERLVSRFFFFYPLASD